MVTSFTKILVIYFCINALLFTGGVRVIGGDSLDILNDFINVNQTGSGQVVVSSNLVGTLPESLEESGTVSQTLQFVDSIGAIKKFVGFIVNIVFTPLGLFAGAGVPNNIVLIAGVPLMMLLWVGVAYFIRSGT